MTRTTRVGFALPGAAISALLLGSASIGTGVTPALAAPASCARTVPVSGPSALSGAVSSAQPGDCLMLADGSYSALTIGASGTASAPIWIQSQNLLGATFGGLLELTGSYVTLSGLHFGGTGTLEFNNTVGSRVTRSLFNATSGGHSFINMTGAAADSNRIDHNELGPQTQPLISEIFVGGASTRLVQHTQIDHNYLHDIKPGPNNTNTIQLGISSAFQFMDSDSIIEDNLFVHCDGENEMIEIKSQGNIVRYNTMHGNLGAISLREGNNNTVYGNFVFGDGIAGTQGIRMWGNNHVVYDNYVEVSGDAMDIGVGDANAVPKDHYPLINATIVDNTFIGAPGASTRAGRPVAPDKLTFVNNIVEGGVAWAVAPTNSTVSNNIGPGGAGFRNVNPMLTVVDGIQQPAAGSPAIGAGSTAYGSLVTDDVEGKPRSSPPTIGASEFSSSAPQRLPLTTADVGPNSPPDTVGGPLGAPTGVTAVANGGGGATVTWSAPSSNGGSAITAYAVYAYSASGVTPIQESTTTSIVFSGLTPNQYYTFTTIAYNGGWGPWSAWASYVLIT